MTVEDKAQGFLVLPRLQIQNANAISSPLTHGFPAMTAFLGLMWALDRKLAAANIPLVPTKVGVICHDYEEQVQDGYVKTFRLTRNPVDKDGSTAGIVEEGRIHLDVTLVFQMAGGSPEDKDNLIFHGDDTRRRELAWQVRDTLDTMRVAGGTVLPAVPQPGRRITPQLIAWPDDTDAQDRAFRRLRRAWLPGFSLVSRDDLLLQHFQKLHASDVNATVLDAWLDLARFNYRSHQGDSRDSVVWKHDRPRGSGWIVPISVGYSALSSLYEGGQVLNARDNRTPFRFVESVYSMGQWISPHRLSCIQDLLWEGKTLQDQGLYLCRNGYVPPSNDEPLDSLVAMPASY
ncbi:type I-F CRISPR-associated protein Csy2 [Pusillimonas sp.]|uniref:type I-F CRISPR-associated protein Csy2 n=1 Tax=Pusillimonas sp. TaxID=3040095 RepID=UPI0037CAD4C7